MHRFIYLALTVIAALGYSGSAAGMTGPSEVVVVNDPLAVEVTNPASPSLPARFQLVGFTSATFLGDVGLFGFSRECGAEFPDSRMCLSEEILKTVEIPDGLAGNAWVQPSFTGGGSVTSMIDASGVAGSNQIMFCGFISAWSDTTRHGLTVDLDGRFRIEDCDVARSVACCAMVP